MKMSSQEGMGILRALVSASGWHSSDTRFLEALPHMSEQLDATDLVETLDNLGVPMRVVGCRLNEVCADDCPALFIQKNGKIFALLDVSRNRVLVLRPNENEQKWEAATSLAGTLVRLERFAQEPNIATIQGFGEVAGRYSGLVPWLVIATFMTNLMSLATPLMIMFIYDRVIPSESIGLLLSLLAAFAIVVVSDACFRYARTAAIAHVGQEIERRLGIELFRKLLSLPANQIQRTDVEQQVARFKQFEGLRDVFTGQILTTITDIPFTAVFCLVLFIISPQVGFLVSALMVIFVVATFVTLPFQKRFDQQAAKSKSDLQNNVFETIKNQQAIQRLGIEDYWTEQNKVLVEDASTASRKSNNFKLVTQSVGQGLMTFAGVGAVFLSTLSAMNGDMSFGALIAVMSLVWKTLTPLQSLFSSAPQIVGFLQSKKQADRVLSLPEELIRGSAQTHQTTFAGRIVFSGVTHRYEGASSYALSQLNLEILPGECVLIGGGNDSGKSTLANLTCNLYQPLAGSIQLDGIDIRQIPVDDLRRVVTYIQPKAEFFYGTISQNFRLAAPSISESEILEAISDMGLDAVVDQMPEGIHTRLTEAFRSSLPETTLNGLSVARGFSRSGPVVILNEPSVGLDAKGNSALLDTIRKHRETRTIVIASQDPIYMEIADRFVFLDQGRLVLNDVSVAGRKKFEVMSKKLKDGHNVRA